MFVNKFLDLEELGDYLYMTDVYLSPYPNLDQAVSGTLSFAIGCGRAVVATPYEHAKELLAYGRGLVAKDTHPRSLAEKLQAVLGDPVLKAELESKARALGEKITWANVALEYLKVAAEVKRSHARTPYRQEKNKLGL